MENIIKTEVDEIIGSKSSPKLMVNDQVNADQNPSTSLKRSDSQRSLLNTDDDDGMNDINTISKRRREDDMGKYILVITNVLGQWTSDDVIEYLKENCGVSISKIRDSRDSNTDFQIRLKFKTKQQRHVVFTKLKVIEEEGKIHVEIDNTTDSDESDCGSDTTVYIEEKEIKSENVPYEADVDVWAPDPKGLYGLKESFLDSLNIKPPITKWITVTNFRCDKVELKEVLELAGHVVLCSVVSVINKYANVMYSHPLEAVQAISMLNGQTFYGKVLKLTMENHKEFSPLLPKGLIDIGPGLGKSGKPLRDIVKQYERLLSGKKSRMNDTILQTYDGSTKFSKTETISESVSPNGNISNQSNVESSQNPKTIQNKGPVGERPNGSQFVATNTPIFHNEPITNHPQSTGLQMNANPREPFSGVPVVQMFGMRGPYANISQMNPRPNTNIPMVQNSQGASMLINQDTRKFIPNPMNTATGVFTTNYSSDIRTQSTAFRPGPQIYDSPSLRQPGPPRPTQFQGVPVEICRGTDSVTLRISNLPQGATFAALCCKLSAFGQVTSLVFTTPGCAVAKFSNSSEAERCFVNYRKNIF